jgi:hypothetical protein
LTTGDKNQPPPTLYGSCRWDHYRCSQQIHSRVAGSRWRRRLGSCPGPLHRKWKTQSLACTPSIEIALYVHSIQTRPCSIGSSFSQSDACRATSLV